MITKNKINKHNNNGLKTLLSDIIQLKKYTDRYK